MKTEPRQQLTSRYILNGAGKRVTSQRALLLDLIRREGGHPEAEELYRQAKEKQPRLSLSTVYRALQLFKNLGLVEEHHFEEEHHHYEAKPATEHSHLVCIGCGKVVEVECSLIPQIKEEIGEKSDFEVISAKIRLVGFCPQCRAAKI